MKPTSERASGSVAIIGAGIIGLSSATNLQRKRGQVTVFDPLPPGTGSSFGNAGLISVDSCIPISLPGVMRKIPGWLMDPLGPVTVKWQYIYKSLPWLLRWLRAARMDRVREAVLALRALHAPAMDSYRELLGPRFGDLVRTSGQIYVWDGDQMSHHEQLSQEIWRQHGIETVALSTMELRRLVPGISTSVKRALLFPRNGYTINPHRLVCVLADSFHQAGGTLRHERAMKIVPVPSGGYRLLTNTGDYRFDKVVVAAGAWSLKLLKPLGLKLPLDTERGYHITIAAPGVQLSMPLLHKDKAFGVTPMENGIRLAGTVEIAGLDLPMDERRAENLLVLGRSLLPALKGAEFSAWMGFRPSLPDSVPVIEEAPTHRGLFIACGHGHTGITAGATTGKLVSELVLGQKPAIDLSPYRSSRFH